MANKLNVGDPVRLLRVEAWLLRDLLPQEQQDILRCIGKTTRISEIDAWGGIWISFASESTVSERGVMCGGPTFLVQPDWIEAAR